MGSLKSCEWQRRRQWPGVWQPACRENKSWLAAARQMPQLTHPPSFPCSFNPPADGYHLNVKVLARTSCQPEDLRWEALTPKCYINMYQCGWHVSMWQRGQRGRG